MVNSKEIKNRIQSIANTQKITKAMKLVAAAKFHQAYSQLVGVRPYSYKMVDILSNLLLNSTDQKLYSLYIAQRPIHKMLLIPIASDRGLCGAFNTHILQKTIEYIASVKKNSNNLHIDTLPIGKKIAMECNKKKWNTINKYVHLLNILSYKQVGKLGEFIMNNYQTKVYDKVVLIYNKYINAIEQVPQVIQFLPMKMEKNKNISNYYNYIYEPSKKNIVSEIAPKALKTQLLTTLWESSTSEHSARMTVMNQATDNAEELLDHLYLSYNRTRQTNITNELTEIISGTTASENI